MTTPASYRDRVVTETASLIFYRDACAEFVGTFVLVSVQCFLVLSWGDSRMGVVTQVGVGMGFTVVALANSLGEFSGGHFNPAVSVAMAAAMKITVFRALVYIVAQCVGGIAGAGMAYGVTPANRRESLAATVLHPEVTPVGGMFIEMFITFNLVMVILGSTNKTRKKIIYMPPIPIGFSIAIGIMSAFRSTGGSMNPARTLGPAAVMGIWDDHWVYWIGPILGGLLAVLIYCVVLDNAEIYASKLTSTKAPANHVATMNHNETTESSSPTMIAS